MTDSEASEGNKGNKGRSGRSRHKDLRKISLMSSSCVHCHLPARIPLRSLDLLDIINRVFCVSVSDVRILNITSQILRLASLWIHDDCLPSHTPDGLFSWMILFMTVQYRTILY